MKKIILGSQALLRPLKHSQNPSVDDFYYGQNPARNRLSVYELVNGVICALDRKVKITIVFQTGCYLTLISKSMALISCQIAHSSSFDAMEHYLRLFNVMYVHRIV